MRSPRVPGRLVIGDPGLGFGQFVDGRTGRDHLGDGNVVDGADRLDDVVPGNAQGSHDVLHRGLADQIKQSAPFRSGSR